MSPPLVVLTDFTAVAPGALTYEAGLALPLQAHLILLHVRHSHWHAPEVPLESNSQQTRHLLYQLADNQPVPTQVEVSTARLETAVEDAIRHHQPQLLVLGRPSPDVTPTAVISSATQELLRHVQLPVLVVPTTSSSPAPPRRLLLALDGEDFSLYDSQQIVPQLLRNVPGSMHLLHVQSSPVADPPARTVAQLQLTARRSGLVAERARLPVHRVVDQCAATGIQLAATALGVDLVVLIARPHLPYNSLYHQSVSARVIAESPVPVLLLPALD